MDMKWKNSETERMQVVTPGFRRAARPVNSNHAASGSTWMGMRKRKPKQREQENKHLLFHFNSYNQEGGIIPILQNEQLRFRKNNGRVGFKQESL